MVDPSIRLAVPAEAEACADLWLAFQREHNRRYVRTVRLTRANRAAMAAHFAKLQAVDQLWVVVDAGRAVGFAAVSPNLPKIDVAYSSAALTDLWLDPPYRGRGLGRRLIDRVVADVAARGLDAVTISVQAGNPARRLYRAAGFQPLSETLIMPVVAGAVRTGPGYVADGGAAGPHAERG